MLPSYPIPQADAIKAAPLGVEARRGMKADGSGLLQFLVQLEEHIGE